MREKTERIILGTVKKKHWIIHGGKAIMKQLPSHLKRTTEDYDIWAKGPKTASIYMEQRLEKREPGEQFRRESLRIGGKTERYTYRVIDRETNKVVADFTTVPGAKNLYVLIGGIRWETLEHAKIKYKQILANPALRQRHAKAKGDLMRVEQFEYEAGHNHSVKKSTLDNLGDIFKFSKTTYAVRSF